MKRCSHADEYHTGIGCGGRKRARPFENVEPDRGSDSDRDAVGLTFSEAARITAVSAKKYQEPKQTLTPPSGAPAEHISVAVPKLAPGSYTLSWRVMSDDNHSMSGELHFNVSALTTH